MSSKTRIKRIRASLVSVEGDHIGPRGYPTPTVKLINHSEGNSVKRYRTADSQIGWEVSEPEYQQPAMLAVDLEALPSKNFVITDIKVIGYRKGQWS